MSMLKRGKLKLSGSPPKNAAWNSGTKHQTNVCVFLVAIKIVLAALVKRDDVRAQSAGLQRLGFDRGDLSASRRKRFGIRRACFHRSRHARGDVFDAYAARSARGSVL